MLLVLVVYFLVAVTSGVLGCFVLWNKMANFADGAAHAGVLGLALAHVFAINSGVPVCLSIALFTLLMHLFTRSNKQMYDTLIAVVSKGMAAVGIAILALSHGQFEHELGEVFLGIDDHISVTMASTIIVISLLVLIVTFCRRKRWVIVMIDMDLARVEGINASRVKLEIGCIAAAYIILLINVVGVVMAASALIISAAISRYLTSDHIRMMAISATFGSLAVCVGYISCQILTIPLGVSFVAALFIFFLIVGSFESRG